MDRLVPLQGAEIPASSGSIDFQEFFPGMKVVVDHAFRGFIKEPGSEYRAPPLYCNIYQLRSGSWVDDGAVERFGGAVLAEARIVCSLLKYLGGEGNALLAIPAGAPDENVILGYVQVTRTLRFVLFVEHQKDSRGVEEIHLHAREANRWNDRAPKIVVVVGK